ncbi:hypothetical protein [Ferrovibrio terrae]|uniref:hypothetical protein n=1 Tax=Ferrovibrio terrae TaxID=2594003 RepID=UPI003138249B
MVTSVTGNPITAPQAATKVVRVKTDAEVKLDTVRADLKKSSALGGAGATPADLARRKIEHAKLKLAGLTLAAGSAAALGNGRMARSVADDIRMIARDLSRALSGSTGSGITPPQPKALTLTAPAVTDPSKPLTAAQSAAAQIKAELGLGPAGSIDTGALAGLKADAATVTSALAKVMKKLQLTGMNPLLQGRDRSAMQSAFGDATRELANLQKASAPTTGMTVNLRT